MNVTMSKWFLASLVIMALTLSSAQATLVLSLDARSPGPVPATQWEDLSGVNAPFTGSNPPVYNAGSQVYEYGRGAQIQAFTSQGADEANFDFPSNPWNGAPNPAGEMTLVAYLDNTGFTGNGAFFSKGDGNMPHTRVDLTAAGGNDLANMSNGIGNGAGDRALSQATGAAATTQLDLYVFHFNGRQAASEWEIYINGSTTNVSAPVGGAANGNTPYTGNADQLYIGSAADIPNEDVRWFGDIQLIEVYSGSTIDNNLVSGMSPADYSQFRFANLGSTVLPVPEPSTLMLLLAGGLLAMRRPQR